VLVGCDPVDLEQLATRCDAVAGRLRSVRVQLDGADRRAWLGPSARRSWAAIDALAPRLGRAAVTWALLARRLRAHATAQRQASLGPPSHRVLWERTAGDGRWVARTGAPTAATVVVLVPGVGTSRADRGELSSDATRVWERLAVEAGRSGIGQDDVAVVSWLGYDPPDHLLAGLARRPAEVGGASLAAEVAMLQAGGARRVVVVGHSYGGLVAVRGAADGMRADEVVLLGAPGLGVADPGALRLAPGADLWAATEDLDAVSLAARTGWVHGPDPVPLARRLPTSRSGHGAYLDDPAVLDALARLALHDPRPAGTVPRTVH
jgi:pimeloyl-ACP methyl ester carboxylesterase